MSTSRALLVFRTVFVAFIVFASARALLVVDAFANSAHIARPHLIALACVEILAAIALLWERTELAAAGVLLLVFGTAAVLDATAGDIPIRYAYYSATALFVVFLRRRLAARFEPPKSATDFAGDISQP